MREKEPIHKLLEIMAALRTPETGCAWDLKQDFQSIAPYTIEEAYEVIDAIERGDMAELKEELGDLLLQVVFHARMAEEQNMFNFSDVAQAISEKMVRRHPHVFHDETDPSAQKEDAIRQNWEEIKQAEKRDKGKTQDSLLDDIPLALPGMTRAVKLQKRAAKTGFDWQDAAPIFDKLEEEIAELKAALQEAETPQKQAHIQGEFGDILFVMANLGRHLKLDPESAIRTTNQKFTNRFQFMEEKAKAADKDLSNYTSDELENLWLAAKNEIG